jgi:hypothetical protein
MRLLHARDDHGCSGPPEPQRESDRRGRSVSSVFLARRQTHIGPRWPIYDNGLAVADSFHREECVWRHDSDETRPATRFANRDGLT